LKWRWIAAGKGRERLELQRNGSREGQTAKKVKKQNQINKRIEINKNNKLNRNI
jgi:hypothetical protein